MASELWPSAAGHKDDHKESDGEDTIGDSGLSLEDQIAKEVSAMKGGRKVDLFGSSLPKVFVF